MGLCLKPRNYTPVIWDHHPEHAPSLTHWRMNGAFLAMSAPMFCISWWSIPVKTCNKCHDRCGRCSWGRETEMLRAWPLWKLCVKSLHKHGTVTTAAVAGGLQQPQVLRQTGHLGLSLQYLCFCAEIDTLAENRASRTLSPTYFQHPSPLPFSNNYLLEELLMPFHLHSPDADTHTKAVPKLWGCVGAAGSNVSLGSSIMQHYSNNTPPYKPLW